MESSAAQSFLVMIFSATSAVACCVLAFSAWASRSTRAKRSSAGPSETLSSLEAYKRLTESVARLEADQVALFSTLESLTTTVKRLSSRAGMRDSRAAKSQSDDEAPPVGASKADLLRFYGMSGKVGPDFARAQQELELERKKRN